MRGKPISCEKCDADLTPQYNGREDGWEFQGRSCDGCEIYFCDDCYTDHQCALHPSGQVYKPWWMSKELKASNG